MCACHNISRHRPTSQLNWLAKGTYTSGSRISQHEPIETRDQTAVKEEEGRTDLYVVRT